MQQVLQGLVHGEGPGPQAEFREGRVLFPEGGHHLRGDVVGDDAQHRMVLGGPGMGTAVGLAVHGTPSLNLLKNAWL